MTPRKLRPADRPADEPAGLGLDLALIVLLALSALLLLFGGGPLWSAVGLGASPALGAALGRFAVLAPLLYLVQRGYARGLAASGWRRGLTLAAVCAIASAALFALARETHIGDWETAIWTSITGIPLGKWLGASLLYHAAQSALSLFDVQPLASVQLFSALCGALAMLCHTTVLRALGLPERLRAWPALLAGAFGVVGISLGHTEIYAVVALGLGVVAVTGLQLVRAPSAKTWLVFSGVVGLALPLYLGCMLLAPVWLLTGLYAAWTRRAAAKGPLLALALAGALLVVIPAGVLIGAGPKPTGRDLGTIWGAQFESGRQEGRVAPCSLPDDVHWSLARNLVAPGYWFSGWHVRDSVSLALSYDRLGLLLVLALAGTALGRAWRARSLPPELFFLGTLALPFLALAFLAVPGKLYPWDWDLVAYGALPLSLLGAALLVPRLPETGARKRTEWLIAGVAALSLLSGVLLFESLGREPERWTPVGAGLSAGITPGDLELAGDSCAHVELWLRNDSSRPVPISPRTLELLLADPNGRWGLAHARNPHPITISFVMEPGEALCLATVDFDPTPVREGQFPPEDRAARALWVFHSDLDRKTRSSFSSGEIKLRYRAKHR